ncbi:multiple C2 and transmembrane domain-containing protein-like isoform X2 [Cydia amplana]|uniref:multiple C2 and transmembrane domain-containing protein-like isoform X2 n=1 Tax=Cydia amplana TaxID=1869771 RepID=UPI002FE6AA59
MSFKGNGHFSTKSHLECSANEESHATIENCKQTYPQLRDLSSPRNGSELARTVDNSDSSHGQQLTEAKTLNNEYNLHSKSNHNIVVSETRALEKSNGNVRQRSMLQTWTSFAVPEGLAMDPLAPAPLAVSTEFMERIGSGLSLLRDHGKKVHKYVWKNRRFDILRRSWKSTVNVTLVDAKDLPYGPSSGSNGLYCKFKLGNETHKSKQVPKSKPTWCERFNLYQYDDNHLEVTVWHKGKQKNFMGRCTIDLSRLERERTHELWQELECGYGALHLLVTLGGPARGLPLDSVPTTRCVHHVTPPENKYTWYRLDNDWAEVGQISVTVYGARGLSALGISGKADAYCVLELDNARVQTHTVTGTSEPMWNKSYTFGVNDITSTLDITVYDESFINSKKGETLGKISIPLLRINNDEKRWYALKNRSKMASAKGNCPRILLEMSIAWNPIKASLRVLSPKETKYIQKPAKFDIPLIYSNLVFIKDIFHVIYLGNEQYKVLFEWENRERSVVALAVWLGFWYCFQAWMLPLLLLAAFLYQWTGYRSCNNNALVPVYTSDDDLSDEEIDTQKDEMTIKARLYELQDLTFTTKNSIDYIVSVIERMKNLIFFSVPYLSYLAMILLISMSLALYLVPVNYIFMVLGVYKFTRKLLNPERVPNNDLLDFLSRVPDDKELEWRELKVPEPNLNRQGSIMKRR